ncbi:MAG: TolC family protein, partial [Polyangiaceae bacterium]|nr:TolC family protein [Polyangiaceae bacterium]
MPPGRRVIAATIMAFAALAGLLARPGGALAETLTWAQVKQRAAARSPGAIEARQAVRAAQAEAAGAGRWPRENPSISGSFETGAPFGEPHDRAWSVGIEQELDVVGVAGVAARAAEERVAVAGREAEVLRRDALVEAGDAFFELDRAQRALAVWIDLEERFRILSAATAKAAAAGEKSALDAILADVDGAGAATELAQAKGDLARAQARLGVLVGASDPAALRVETADAVPPPDPRTSARLAEAARRRPELSLWRARLAEAEARGAYASRSVVPRPVVGLVFRRQESESGREAFVGDPGGLLGIRKAESALEVTLAVPIPLFARSQAERARATADASTAREQIDLAGREARAAALQAGAQVDAAWTAL